MTYDNNDKGALFKNTDKESDKHPDYKGSINVGGVDYWISAWLNTSAKGTKYMGLAVTEKKDVPQNMAKANAPAQNDHNDDFDDDLPF